jgi:plastocyanin
MSVRFGFSLAMAFLLSGAQANAGDLIQVKIDQLAFAPAELAAHVGDTIEWKNADFVAHTATDPRGAFDVIIPAGASRRLVLDRAGTFDYYCRFHPTMKGELRVM